ncbi:MAG: RecQ family ATP-dependent DNA helicase [Bacteroidales bacterium]|nr:RecQ family ATP-dependent DNA helicase [Bacteroidales bacterium]
MTTLEILKKYWHYDSFRPMQEEIIRSVLEGNDTLALLPTGGGKSLCYQIPALAQEGIAIVVSPLIALMKDQVRQLTEKHIKARCIVSGMSKREIEIILNNCIHNDIKLLYVSPERLLSRIFIDHLRQMNVSLIAVDEAHCISQWGFDFRPPYCEIARIRQYHPSVPVLALTATATSEVISDIEEKLAFRKGKLFKGSFFRRELSYSVFEENDKQGRLLRIIRKVGGSGIVYVRNRRRTVEIANILNDNNIPAAAYHAGIAMKERDRIQKEWQTSNRGVMVATNAFGMGIDKPDVRFVVHLDLPDSPEEYFQEAGRAGRDGRRAYAVMLYQKNDIERMLANLERDFPSRQYIRNVYRAVCNYYQIPVGAGQDSHFDFDLEQICNTYNLEVYTAFKALNFLEREGLISLPDHSELQSRLFFKVGKEELYRYQLSNRVAGDMITSILRLYGGLFTDYGPISENKIAQRCGLSETQVSNMLKELHRLQIADYQPKTLKPQIVFAMPRVDINELYVSDRSYSELKEASKRRRTALADYLTNDSECRSQQLLRYFGEEESSQCGICDVCAANRKKKTLDSEAMINAALKEEGAMNIKQLANKLPQMDKETLSKTVRKMLDSGKLSMDQDFLISCCNSK